MSRAGDWSGFFRFAESRIVYEYEKQSEIMTSYRIPCGKHKDKAIDNLSDNILAGLLWAYRPEGLDNEELHGECFAVLYSRHGTAKAVAELADKFAAWAESPKKPKKSKTKKKKAKAKLHQCEEDPNRVLFSMIDKDIFVPNDVVIGHSDELPPF